MSELGVTDALARESAIDPSRSFIVQAPAGSGKTELLIQRFLALLAGVREPEEIVAITFTRKAAAEMRSRVVAALKSSEEDENPTEAHEQNTRDLARAAMTRGREREWNLSEMSGRLRIQTIDSLCHSLTRQMPITSEMGAVGTVEDRSDELYEEAVRATLAEVESGDVYAEPVAILLEHLGNDVRQAERLLVGMLRKRGHWLDLVHGDHERDVLENALRGAVEAQLAELVGLFTPEVRAELLEVGRHAASNLIRDGREHEISTLDGLVEFPNPEGEALHIWRALRSLLLTNEGRWRSPRGMTVALGFPTGSEGKGLKAHHAALVETLAGIDGLKEALRKVKTLPPPHYSDEQWQMLQALFDVLKRSAEHLQSVFSARSILDHQEVQVRALLALGADMAPTELALRLDYRIQHLLVDEFQDTSRGQFELLEQLTEGWTPGDGRTLFVVGDPMQSIYRFREAEVALFLQAKRSGIGTVTLEPLTLRRNFRSNTEIVAWFNDAFPLVLPPQSDPRTGAVSYEPCEATRGAAGRVAVHPFYDNDKASEARRVVEIVEERLAESGGSIAILVRSRRHLGAIVPAFHEAGIAFRGKDLERLGERPEVKDLLALTRALLHPGDRTAWLAVLRAPWCGLSLEDLTALLADEKYRTVQDLLINTKRTNSLSPDGAERLEQLEPILDKAWQSRRRRSLARWVEGSWLALGGPATLTSPIAMAATRVYFELLEELAEGGDLINFKELEDQSDEIFAPTDPDERIRVEMMTMHTAKGLQFDTVILPGLGRGTRGDDPQPLVWLEHPIGGEDQLLMGPIRGAFEADPDPVYTFIRKLDQQQAAFEDGRLLYVASTRAQEQLHLFGHAKYDPEGDAPPVPKSGSLLEKLWPAVATKFADNTPTASPGEFESNGKATPSLPQTIRRFRLNWGVPSPPEPAPLHPGVSSITESEPLADIASLDRTARNMGTVVHRALMRIARDGVSNWEGGAIRDRTQLWERLLVELGVGLKDRERMAKRIVDALAQTLQDDRGRWILDSHEHSRSEYSMNGIVNGSARRFFIDRTFVEDGLRWIIDFKTAMPGEEGMEVFLERQKERYREQLEGYARLFANEGLPIRLGLYFPMTSEWIDWKFGQ